MSNMASNIKPQTYDVFVANLPPDSNQKAIQKIFSKCGNVQSVTYGENRKGPGYIGYVRFFSEEDAEKACVEFNGQKVQGNQLKVIRTQRNKTPSGGGGGGGGGGPRGQQGFGGHNNRQDRNRDNITSPPRQNRSNFKQEPDIVPKSPMTMSTAAPKPEFLSKEQIMVTHVEDPVTFWAQIMAPDAAALLMKITESMIQVCPQSTKLTSAPEENKVYATIFSEDSMWYRCQLVEKINADQCKVQYIDYGNYEIVLNCGIVELPITLSSPSRLAKKFTLLNARPTNPDSTSETYKSGMDQLRSLADQMIECDVLSNPVNSNERYAKLFHQGENLNDALMANGLIENIPEHSETSPQTENPFMSYNSPIRPPNRGDNNPNRYANPGFHDNRGQSQQLEMIKQELQQAHQDKQALKDERDESVIDLATTKGKLKLVQGQLYTLNTQLQQSSVSYKMKLLITGVNKVKTLRLQFPTDSSSKDNVDLAINLIVNPTCKISLSQLAEIAKVTGSIQVYQDAQLAVRKCTNKVDLESFVQERNRARLHLNESLVELLGVIAELPLRDRESELQHAIDSLLTTHKTYANIKLAKLPSAEEAVTAYQNWKNKVKAEFCDVRTKTNTCHNAVDSALLHLRQTLSFDSSAPVEPVNGKSDLDTLFQRLQTAVDEEISKCSMEESNDDAVIIATVVQALLREMRDEELRDIEELSRLNIEYKLMHQSLSRWLNDTPDMSDINTVRKTIKALKSKLRHKIADKSDLEENDSDEDPDELSKLNAELTDIREQLHAALVHEDTLMVEISKLYGEHFPELNTLYPDLGLSYQLEYNGLVKTGRSLDQFDVEKLPGSEKSSTMKSSFNKQPVVLKEFILGEQSSMTKDTFLQSALKYQQRVNGGLVPLDAVFMSKNERFAYTQTCMYESNLPDYLMNNQISHGDAQQILLGVLRGIAALHDVGMVHGQIHPHNVYITDSVIGVLSEYDLTKSQEERALNRGTDTGKMAWQGPEVLKPGLVSPATDLYCFGLLAFYIHFFRLCTEATQIFVPSVAALGSAHPVCSVIQSLLTSEPSQRPRASDLLRDSYFSTPMTPTSKSTRVSPEGETLQLRPKQPSPTCNQGQKTGILKNSPASSPVLAANQPQARASPPILTTVAPSDTPQPQAVPIEDLAQKASARAESASSGREMTIYDDDDPFSGDYVDKDDEAFGIGLDEGGDTEDTHNTSDTIKHETTFTEELAQYQEEKRKAADKEGEEADGETATPVGDSDIDDLTDRASKLDVDSEKGQGEGLRKGALTLEQMRSLIDTAAAQPLELISPVSSNESKSSFEVIPSSEGETK
ncbi:unnamed protein product [Owenia fusiformis]|uniref:Uncharacterized protein n=1 Tax=Owenia fusiformis TaxID=6347 RepID=A0A8J1UKX0_OWEFU|nr:unnamed protein product [Owenia fusiformis]